MLLQLPLKFLLLLLHQFIQIYINTLCRCVLHFVCLAVLSVLSALCQHHRQLCLQLTVLVDETRDCVLLSPDHRRQEGVAGEGGFIISV